MTKDIFRVINVRGYTRRITINNAVVEQVIKPYTRKIKIKVDKEQSSLEDFDIENVGDKI